MVLAKGCSRERGWEERKLWRVRPLKVTRLWGKNNCIYGQIINRVCKNRCKNSTLVGRRSCGVVWWCLYNTVALLPLHFAQSVHTVSLLSSYVTSNAGLEIVAAQFYAKKVYASILWIINYANTNCPLMCLNFRLTQRDLNSL